MLSIFFMAANLLPKRSNAQGASIDFQVFYNELSPYGTWIDHPEYGYVWMPRVARGFTPYGSNGYWVFTDEGWTWVSNYSWGWAPFHYGRWFYDDFYGPMWVPGNEWGPGWVTWRRSEGYYGWAPIGPGISISVAYGSGYDVPYNHWRFVRDRDFGRTNISNYYVNTNNYTTIINSSVVINNSRTDRQRNVSYNAGPERNEVERHAGRLFKPMTIAESNKPGQRINKQQLQLYRPQVRANMDGGGKAMPAKVMNMKDGRVQGKQMSEKQGSRGNTQLETRPLNNEDRSKMQDRLIQDRKNQEKLNQGKNQQQNLDQQQRSKQAAPQRAQPANIRPQQVPQPQRQDPPQRTQPANVRPQQAPQQQRQDRPQPAPAQRPDRQEKQQQTPIQRPQAPQQNERPARNQGNSARKEAPPVKSQDTRSAPREESASQKENPRQENPKEDTHNK